MFLPSLNAKLLNSSFKVDRDAQIITYCESHEKLMQGRRKVWKPALGGEGQVVMRWASPLVVIRLPDLSKPGGIMPIAPPPPCPSVSDTPFMSNWNGLYHTTHFDIWGTLFWVAFTPRIYKGRIDGDSYYTMHSYVNLIRACKKVLYQLVYLGKKFVFLKEPLYI